MKKKIAFLTAAAVTVLSAGLLVGCGETHSIVKVEASDPTCAAAGNIEYYKCYDDGCGKIFSDAAGKHEVSLDSVLIKALGHTVTGIGTAVDATCTENGITAGEKCTVCGALVTDQQVIQKTGHHATKVDGTPATCEEDGALTYYHCADCGVDFLDEKCEIEAKDVVLKALGHAYGEWEFAGNGTHQKVCDHDHDHVETVACTYGDISDFTDGTGHYLTCKICGGTSEKLPHVLEYTIEGNEHYATCKDCDYVSERVEHSADTLNVEVIGEKMYGGRTITKNDIRVEMLCECGHYELVDLEAVTFADAVLVDGLNKLTLNLGGEQFAFNYDAPEEPRFDLTIVGATFANGTNTIALKEGESVGDITLDRNKTFVGYRNGLTVLDDLSEFAMPDSELTLTALYEEDMIVFTPSDRTDTGAVAGEHVKVDDVGYATRYTWTQSGDDGKIIVRGSKDSATVKGINVHAPAHKESLMFLYVVNNSEKDIELLYQVENYYLFHGEITIVAKANSTTRVPFIYGSSQSNQYGQVGTFSTCDHYLTVNSEIANGESVSLDIYGRLVSTENNKLQSIFVSLPDTFNNFFEDGDTIDLTDMTVTGSLSGYSVTIPNYTCNIESGTAWTSDITELKVEFAGFEWILKFNSYDNWIHTALPDNPLLADPRGDACDWLSAEHITDSATGRPSTRFTFKAGTAVNSEAFVNPTNDKGANADYNTSMPQHSGKSRNVMIFVKNTSNAVIKFRAYYENYGDIGGVDIEVPAGESKTFTCVVTASGPYPTTTGCCINIKLLEAIGDSDVTIEMYTMYQAYSDEITGIAVNDGSQKTTFTVGETFSASGVRCSATTSYASETNMRVTNVSANLDGHVFTEDDIGEKTVTVTWNGLTATYTINVVAAD